MNRGAWRRISSVLSPTRERAPNPLVDSSRFRYRASGGAVTVHRSSASSSGRCTCRRRTCRGRCIRRRCGFRVGSSDSGVTRVAHRAPAAAVGNVAVTSAPTTRAELAAVDAARRSGPHVGYCEAFRAAITLRPGEVGLAPTRARVHQAASRRARSVRRWWRLATYVERFSLSSLTESGRWREARRTRTSSSWAPQNRG